MAFKEFIRASKHTEIERFFVLGCVVLSLLAVLTVVGFFAQQEHDRVTLGTQAVYTERAVGSLSGAAVSVEGVYANADKTRALALIKYEDAALMNTDADQYSIFVTGAQPNGEGAQLESSPAGAVYVFGSTGYVGIYLTAADGFPTQIVDVVLRADRQMADSNSDGGEEAVSDASFSKYEQVRLYFNPGAEDAVHASCLDAEVPDARAMYEECVVRAKEAELRDTLEDSLEQMEIKLNQITEYTERAERDGVAVLEAPAAIAGDVIEVDEEGNRTLVAASRVPGGFDFDWRSGSISEGYLDAIVQREGSGRSASKYLTDMTAEASNSTFELPKMEDWKTVGGTPITQLSSTSDSQYQTYQSDISLLTNAWNEYYTLKHDYQVKHLRALLDAEITADEAAAAATVRSDADCATVY